MSHYPVLVCMDDRSQLDGLLAPYDENIVAEPYRSYEEGEAKDHWLYVKFRDAWDKSLASAQGENPGLDAQARVYVEFFRGDVPTWAEVAALYNAEFQHEDDSGERMEVDAEFPGGARAYAMSTYNKASKWDWWSIGGRWGGALWYKPGCADLVIDPDTGPAASGETPGVQAGTCNGGPKHALDLERTRQAAEDKARENHGKWQELTSGLPEARPWSHFREMIDVVPGYDVNKARQEFQAQPVAQALRGTDFDWVLADAIEKYARPLEDIVAEARAGAVPGYALVRRNGSWLAPGEMGWWAISSDNEASRAAYHDAANAYVDSLPDDAWLIMVDCHI